MSKSNGADRSALMVGSLWSAWMRQALAVSQEISGFAAARAGEDMSAWTELTGCKDPVHFFTCQQQFAQKAIADYMAEGQKIGRMLLAAQTQRTSTQAE